MSEYTQWTRQTPLTADNLNVITRSIAEDVVSKTTYDTVGKKSVEGGEVFNDYYNQYEYQVGNVASSSFSHAEGERTQANGRGSHSEGGGTQANGKYSHAEGGHCEAGDYAHAEGNATVASGTWSHSEGEITKALGKGSHAEGYRTIAEGLYAHAEGHETTASQEGAHSEGEDTVAQGRASHAEGKGTTSSGYSSHTEGFETSATGTASHAEGISTVASSRYQHVEGRYNVEDTDNRYAHIVGNGADANNRSNAHTLDWQGNAWYAGTVSGAAPVNGNDFTTKDYVNSTRIGRSGDATGAEEFNSTSNVASGKYSHAEGHEAHATALGAHAEGGGDKQKHREWKLTQKAT